MNSDRAMEVLRAFYAEIHLALWAILTALVIYFVIFVAPKLPALQVAAERQRLTQIAAVDADYCAKWRMGPASARHNECLEDLQQLRTRIKNRIAEDSDF